LTSNLKTFNNIYMTLKVMFSFLSDQEQSQFNKKINSFSKIIYV